MGDLWIDTDDNNKMYRWDGSTWAPVTDQSALNAFVNGSYATFVTNTNNAIAGKITTFYQASAPTANVVGDLWIDTDDGNKLYRWNGSAWGSIQDAGIQSALTAASNAQSTADGKIVTFAQASAPTATDVGDLWIDTDANNAMYRWNGTTWESVTDISALQTWITGTYASDKSNLQSQIDGKIQTWYQNTDPASAWDTTAKKEAHLGDLWYRTTDRVTLIYQKQNSIYVWLEENVPFAVFDKIDGKAQVFLTQPTPPYFVGDLWFEGASGGIKTCIQARIQYETYHASDWDYKNNYIDQSAITAYDTSLNQTAVFNKLTSNGTLQGIYMDQGDLYINASYIATGTIADTSGNTSWNLTTGALSSKKLSVQSTNFTLTEAGVITATGATLNNATVTGKFTSGSGNGAIDIDNGVMSTANGSIKFMLRQQGGYELIDETTQNQKCGIETNGNGNLRLIANNTDMSVSFAGSALEGFDFNEYYDTWTDVPTNFSYDGYDFYWTLADITDHTYSINHVYRLKVVSDNNPYLVNNT